MKVNEVFGFSKLERLIDNYPGLKSEIDNWNKHSRGIDQPGLLINWLQKWADTRYPLSKDDVSIESVDPKKKTSILQYIAFRYIINLEKYNTSQHLTTEPESVSPSVQQKTISYFSVPTTPREGMITVVTGPGNLHYFKDYKGFWYEAGSNLFGPLSVSPAGIVKDKKSIDALEARAKAKLRQFAVKKDPRTSLWSIVQTKSTGK